MKIKQIPDSQFGSIHDSQSLKLAPTLQLLFGYVDADTSAVRNSIRHFYFGRDFARGQVETDRIELDLTFESGRSLGSRFGDGIRLRNPEVRREWEQTLHEIDYATYQAFFDINFGEGGTSGAQFCFQLRKRFNAPFGDCSTHSQQSRRDLDVSELKQEIAEVNRELASCRSECDRLHTRLEELEGHQVRPYEFELAQKKSLTSRIDKLRDKLQGLRSTACSLETEIEYALQQSVPAKKDASENLRAGKSMSSVGNANRQLDEQLQRVDAQIERWKSVKLDVDSRLTEMKGDLGGSRLGEFDSMFDEVREIVRRSEEKLLEMLDVAGDDGSASTLNSLIEWNHQVCDSLGNLQEQWRDEIFRGEIDSLKRCSRELDGYLGRLAAKRGRLLVKQNCSRNVRCQCKTHQATGPVIRKQVEELNARHEQILEEIQVTEKLLQTATRELQALEAVPDLQSEIELVRQRIQACNQDHSVLQDEKDRLLNQLREAMLLDQRNSQLIQLISGYLEALTEGEWTRLYLDEKGHDLELVDAADEVTRFADLDFVSRIKTRMAISLGCARLLADAGYAVPLVWEDALIGFEPEDLEVVVPVLAEFARAHGQVLLLTNNLADKRFFAERQLPVLDIPDRYSGDSAPLIPQTRPVSGRADADWSDINRRLDLAAMDQYGTESLPTDRHDSERSRQASGNGKSAAKSARRRRVPRRRGNSGPSRADVSRDSQARSKDDDPGQHRFYLELSSRVEAAPTIGPRTAEKLEKIGICTVSDLIAQDPEWIASELNLRRLQAEDVKQWQQQALLVCQVPNLRGHDAQLLVACGVTDAVQLAGMDPEELFDVIGPFAQSKEGKKLLRGSSEPDLQEVRNWVLWASDQRTLKQAA